MKKFKFLALMSAAALTGALFTACSDNDELAAVNPTYDDATGTLTTQFAFNISTSNSSSTRMAAADVQADVSTTSGLSTSNFRGITDVTLLAYQKLTSDGVQDDNKVLTDADKAEQAVGRYNLATILPASSDYPGTAATQRSHRILELALPVGTNTMLFYGKAHKGGLDETLRSTRERYGNVLMLTNHHPQNTTISLTPRMVEHDSWVLKDDMGNIQYDPSTGAPMIHTETESSAQYKLLNDIEMLIDTVLNHIVRNGLYVEETAGAIPDRDLTYHVWWPTNPDNYELVWCNKYGVRLLQPGAPVFTYSGQKYMIAGRESAGAKFHLVARPYNDNTSFQDLSIASYEGGVHNKYFVTDESFSNLVIRDGGSADYPTVYLYNNSDGSYNNTINTTNDDVRIAVSTTGSGTSATTTVTTDVDTYTYLGGSVDWKEYGDKYNAMDEATTGKQGFATDYTLSPLEEIIGGLYYEFTNLNGSGATTELRSGSAASVARMIQDIWNINNKVRLSKPTNVGEALAQLLSTRINTRLNVYFEHTEAEDGAVSGVKWRSPHDIIDSLKVHIDTGIESCFIDARLLTALSQDEFNKFPTNDALSLPMGSAQLYITTESDPRPSMEETTNSVHRFRFHSERITEGSAGFNPDNLAHDVYHYTYPAELMYFGNSPVRVSNISHQETQYPDGVDNWTNWTEPTGYTGDWTSAWTSSGSHVIRSTRSVAMMQNIQYGSALFAYTVRYGANKLYDNNAALNSQSSAGETDQEFDVTSSASSWTFQPNGTSYTLSGGEQFVLTGILIGGQPEHNDWCFLPRGTVDDDNNTTAPVFDYTIYDDQLVKNGPSTAELGTKIAYTSSASDANNTVNYTLVMDNYKALADGETAQNTVKVALEFRNCSGRDFWGLHNMIRDGGTFYILGELDPAGKDVTFPSYEMPPYEVVDANKKRVFIQDYVTKADFVLTANSLKHAYISVPDLRSAELSFGLSVDLNWNTGMNFANVSLGGE